jgi:hypothetical protein
VTTTSTTTFTGLPPIPPVTTTFTDTVKYLGHETVTVPAGTFDTCKFEQNGTGTVWFGSGSAAGISIKSTSNTGGSTALTLVLTAASVNGTAVK